MYRAFIIFCLCIPGLCSAQAYRFDFGLSAPLYFRSSETHTYRHFFGAIGLDGVFSVSGTEENAMSFVLNAGINEDIRKFSIDVNDKVKNSLYFININPSVVIPSRWPHIKFCFGIGALVQLGQRITYSWGAQGPGGTPVDSMNMVLNNNSRSIIPYMSLGVSEDIKKHLRLELTIRPTLLNFYEPGTGMYFSSVNSSGFSGTYLELNYQPVYVGFRLFYFFKGNDRG